MLWAKCGGKTRYGWAGQGLFSQSQARDASCGRMGGSGDEGSKTVCVVKGGVERCTTGKTAIDGHSAAPSQVHGQLSRQWLSDALGRRYGSRCAPASFRHTTPPAFRTAPLVVAVAVRSCDRCALDRAHTHAC